MLSPWRRPMARIVRPNTISSPPSTTGKNPGPMRNAVPNG